MEKMYFHPGKKVKKPSMHKSAPRPKRVRTKGMSGSHRRGMGRHAFRSGY